MNWGIFFGYCYWDRDYRLYAKQVADSGPGLWQAVLTFNTHLKISLNI